MSTQEPHEVEVKRIYNEAWPVKCVTCGAFWKIPYMRQQYKMEEELEKTTKAHTAYFNRPELKPD